MDSRKTRKFQWAFNMERAVICNQVIIQDHMASLVRVPPRI